MNLPRVWDFLAAGYTDHCADTMFSGVEQLRGGELLRLDLRNWKPGDALPVKQYYDVPRQPGTGNSEEAAAEQFRELFFDSVRLHLRSDVRVGLVPVWRTRQLLHRLRDGPPAQQTAASRSIP